MGRAVIQLDLKNAALMLPVFTRLPQIGILVGPGVVGQGLRRSSDRITQRSGGSTRDELNLRVSGRKDVQTLIAGEREANGHGLAFIHFINAWKVFDRPEEADKVIDNGNGGFTNGGQEPSKR